MASAPTLQRQTRKRATDRRVELLEEADATIQRQGSADLPLRDVADRLGISRALVYAYFPDRYKLIDAVLARHVDLLEASGLEQASRNGSLTERATSCAAIYLSHVIEHGRTFELVLREPVLVRQLDGTAAAYRRRILRRLARLAMNELRMGANEALSVIELLTVVPQEAARRAVEDGLSHETVAAICERLIRSSIEAQVPHSGATLSR